MKSNHAINLAFIAFFFISPFFAALYFPDHTPELIAGSFMLAALLIADWYHFNFTNNFNNTTSMLFFSALVSLGCYFLLSTIYDCNVFGPEPVPEDIFARRYVFRIFGTAAFMTVVCLVNYVRLLIFRIFDVSLEMPNQSQEI